MAQSTGMGSRVGYTVGYTGAEYINEQIMRYLGAGLQAMHALMQLAGIAQFDAQSPGMH